MPASSPTECVVGVAIFASLAAAYLWLGVRAMGRKRRYDAEITAWLAFAPMGLGGPLAMTAAWSLDLYYLLTSC